jgi:hypothetical protein
MLDHLITAARTASYQRIRLDSPDFMTSAHALYQSHGFLDIRPYPESEIPDRYKSHWVFIERDFPERLVPDAVLPQKKRLATRRNRCARHPRGDQARRRKQIPLPVSAS